MELSKTLRDHSRTIAGKEQLLIGAVAKALEIIPRQLCDNAGFDATNILNKLRQKHAQGMSCLSLLELKDWRYQIWLSSTPFEVICMVRIYLCGKVVPMY